MRDRARQRVVLRISLAVLLTGCGYLAGVEPHAAAGEDLSHVQHPNPSLASISLDGTAPLAYANGTTAIVPPLEPAETHAALADWSYLRYQLGSDLGGFTRAPVGRLITSVVGHAVTRAPKQAKVPLITKVGSKITIFGYATGTTVPTTPAVPPVPPPKAPTPPVTTRHTKVTTGFRTPTPPRRHHTTPPGTTTSSTTRPPHSTTSTTVPSSSTTTSTTSPPPTSTTSTTAPPSTTTSTTSPPTTTTTTTPPPSEYISMSNSKGTLPVIVATNMEPGESASETLVLANTGAAPFELSMRSTPTSSNKLTRELKLIVTNASGGAVYYDGSLSAATVQIAHLEVNQSIRLFVTLELPLTAGNDVQDETATLDLHWDAKT